MKICIFANCQGDGIAHFIRKVHPSIDVVIHHNWQILMGETSPEALMHDAARCDAFVYQDAPSLRAGMLDTGRICNEVVPPSAKKLSFSYCYNTGFFPIVKSGKWWTGDKVLKAAKFGMPVDYICGDEPNYGCALRFAENLAEQARREQTVTLKFAPFILDNFQTRHLFLLMNHPSSELFVEMTQAVLRAIDPALDVPIPFDHPNEAKLPGYHAVHPAVIRELGLKYEPDRRGEDAGCYRILFAELAAAKGVL